MRYVWVIIKREIGAYFSTPLAYVFNCIFLGLSGALTFFVGNFFERGQADLNSFFNFQNFFKNQSGFNFRIGNIITEFLKIILN